MTDDELDDWRDRVRRDIQDAMLEGHYSLARELLDELIASFAAPGAAAG